LVRQSEELCAYVTDLDAAQTTPAQIVLTYRKRGDADNVFDELTNQQGFSGFCSGKGVVSETAARLLLLNYNLWSRFVRVLKEEGCHRGAITSRDDLAGHAGQNRRNRPAKKPSN
jgi:hypothetical protein